MEFKKPTWGYFEKCRPFQLPVNIFVFLEKNELKFLNELLDNFDNLNCLEVENNWSEELTAFNSLSITTLNTKINFMSVYKSENYSQSVKPILLKDIH